MQLDGEDLVGLGQAEATVQRFTISAYGAQNLNKWEGHEQQQKHKSSHFQNVYLVRRKPSDERKVVILAFDCDFQFLICNKTRTLM